MLRATAELPRQQGMSRSFNNLDEREILALAIAAEEEDGKIYGAYAERVKADYPSTGTILEEMREEESEHRRTLIDLYKARFGDNIPLVRRSDVKGFIRRRPIWMSKVLTIKQIRAEVQSMESEATRFYEKAAEKATNPDVRKLLGDLAL